jgi:hypothetical protein
MRKRFKKGQMVRFLHISSFTGATLTLSGKVIGFGADIRKRWPEEMGEAPDDMLLIKRSDNFGNEFHYAVSLDDLVKEEK